MGKTPNAAAAGMFVAMLTLAGCQSSGPTVGNPGTMSPLAANRAQQPWNNGAASGGTANQAQAGTNGMNNAQVANNTAMTRPQTGQSFGATGNFQGNFGNSGQQPTGFTQGQNNLANNQQSNSFNANQGSNNIQPASYNPGQFGGGVQQAGGWGTNAQATGSAANRNMARNLDAGQAGATGSGSSSMPAPNFPSNSAFGDSPNSKDPPPVAQPATETNYSTRYPVMPFTGGRVGNQ